MRHFISTRRSQEGKILKRGNKVQVVGGVYWKGDRTAVFATVISNQKHANSMVQIEFEEPQKPSGKNYTMDATNVCGYNLLKIETLGDGDSTMQYGGGSSVSTS